MSVMKIYCIMFVTRNECFVGFLLAWIIASIHLGRDVYKSFTGMSAFLSGWTLLLVLTTFAQWYDSEQVDLSVWSLSTTQSMDLVLSWWKISLFSNLILNRSSTAIQAMINFNHLEPLLYVSQKYHSYCFHHVTFHFSVDLLTNSPLLKCSSILFSFYSKYFHHII